MVVFFVLGACATPQPVSQGTPQTPPSTFEYSQFFNRVKEQVRAHWAPPEDLRLGDPTGRIEVAEDRYTLLQVTLRADGSLANIWVVHTCGLDWLDETAIAAFEEAQPFLDPPAEVIEAEHGTITFGFGFFFEASGSPRLKLFRYKSATPQPVSQGTLQASPSAALQRSPAAIDRGRPRHHDLPIRVLLQSLGQVQSPGFAAPEAVPRQGHVARPQSGSRFAPRDRKRSRCSASSRPRYQYTSGIGHTKVLSVSAVPPGSGPPARPPRSCPGNADRKPTRPAHDPPRLRHAGGHVPYGRWSIVRLSAAFPSPQNV